MKTKSVTARLDASREARNDRVDEVVYLLAVLTRTAEWRPLAHIAPLDSPRATSTMNFVVCVHVNDELLVWRISDFERLEYFSHLKERPCARGLSRNDKMLRMCDLAAGRAEVSR
jgi:hypothetical protein